jgi:hypothetical protein
MAPSAPWRLHLPAGASSSEALFGVELMRLEWRPACTQRVLVASSTSLSFHAGLACGETAAVAARADAAVLADAAIAR